MARLDVTGGTLLIDNRPTEESQQERGTVEETGAGCAASEPYALRVLGDSMTPEFEEGMIIIVDPTGLATDGAYVVAEHDGEYIFRQLAIDGGRYLLRPLNPDYDEMEISSLRAVVGVVTQRAGTRRKYHKHYD
jgi:SOS-response transcriptional repressor LexA